MGKCKCMCFGKKDNPCSRNALAVRIVRELAARGLTVTTAESCTGGMVAAALTSVPGSSAVFRQGYVTYCDDAKHAMLGVPRQTLERYTAVSRQTAARMAQGSAARAGADCAVSVTGYAGPPSGDEPVGLVYIGCRVPGYFAVRECHLKGSRASIRRQARDMALDMLWKYLNL